MRLLMRGSPSDNHDICLYALGKDEFLRVRGEMLFRRTGVFCNRSLGSDFLIS